MNKAAAERIVIAIGKTRRSVARKRLKAYFKPFFDAKKPWADMAAKQAADFALAVDALLKQYQKECAKLIRGHKLFSKSAVLKEKKYKAHEYLDERYNRVVVPDIKDALVEMENSLVDSLKAAHEKYISESFVSDTAGLVFQDMGMEFDFNQFDTLARDYLRDKAIRWAKPVAEETERMIKRELVKGFEAGLDHYEIASNIEKASGFSFGRSEKIARTEIGESCNYSYYAGLLANPDISGAEWFAAGDENTRPTHRAANGQIRKLGEPFNINGYKMMFPLDASLGAPAGEIINCRCTILPVKGGDSLKSKTVYDDEDAGSDEWLKRQPDSFQIEYAGGKTKAKLWEAELISLEDRDRPIIEILPEIYPVRTTAAQLRSVSAMTAAAADSAINRANALWLLGKLQGREANSTLNAKTGGKAFKNITGEYGRISDEGEDVKSWLSFLEKAKPRSLAAIHNHNNASSFSLNDIELFLENKSLLSMLVVDADGNLFLLEKKPGVEYNADRVKKVYNNLIRKYAEILRGIPPWVNEEERREILIQYNIMERLMSDLTDSLGLKRGVWRGRNYRR